MKKRRLIPFAALALTCGLMAGVFAGCNGGGETPPPPTEHQHTYTQWDSNGEEHWKVCPDDGAIDESSRKQHTYVDGECECGKEEPAPEIVYGTASGQVQLKKYGAAVTDYSGVTVSVNDDGVTVSYDEETGRFTVSNAVVGTYYRLTVSKEGYEDYQTEFAVQEGSDTVIGGTEGIALNFLYATLDRGGSGAAIDHVNKTISLGGSNTAPDVDGKESSKATLVAEAAGEGSPSRRRIPTSGSCSSTIRTIRRRSPEPSARSRRIPSRRTAARFSPRGSIRLTHFKQA